jgi:hypothetical protein
MPGSSLEQDYFPDTAVVLDDSDVIALAVLVFHEFPNSDGTPYAFGGSDPVLADAGMMQKACRWYGDRMEITPLTLGPSLC